MGKSAQSNGRAEARPWDAIIALGANVGDKAANIDAAIEALTAGGRVRLVARSRSYKTPPWGVPDQDWFVNACVSVATELSAHELLALCQSVEKNAGRIKTKRWGPRVIDLDILFYRNERIESADLIVPHPRITGRAFVLAPLADIAPNLELDGQSVRDWLALADMTGVAAMEPSHK